MADVTRRYTASVLNQDQKQFLKALPLHKELRRQNTRFYLCHAKPSDPLYGYCPADSPDWIGEVQAVSADALLVGHTHAPCASHRQLLDCQSPTPRQGREKWGLRSNGPKTEAAGVSPCTLESCHSLQASIFGEPACIAQAGKGSVLIDSKNADGAGTGIQRVKILAV